MPRHVGGGASLERTTGGDSHAGYAAGGRAVVSSLARAGTLLEPQDTNSGRDELAESIQSEPDAVTGSARMHHRRSSGRGRHAPTRAA
jgi:hypothetical protein